MLKKNLPPKRRVFAECRRDFSVFLCVFSLRLGGKFLYFERHQIISAKKIFQT